MGRPMALTADFPQTEGQWDERPYFLWDLDMSWREFAGCLKSANKTRRLWAMGRLLTEAKWRDVWRLMGRDELRRDLPHLQLKDKPFWELVAEVSFEGD